MVQCYCELLKKIRFPVTLSHTMERKPTPLILALCVDFTLHNVVSVFAFASLCTPVFVVSVYDKI